MKKCTNCGLVKEYSDYYFKTLKTSGKLKVNSQCKTCIKTAVKLYKENYIPLHYRNLESRLRNLLTKAKGRDREVSLTLSQDYLLKLWEQQEGKCRYSGLPLSIEANHPDAISLDRIDSSLGYIEGNLQLVSSTVNRIKLDLGEETFLTYCNLITNNLSKTTQGAEPLKSSTLLTPLSKLAS